MTSPYGTKINLSIPRSGLDDVNQCNAASTNSMELNQFTLVKAYYCCVLLWLNTKCPNLRTAFAHLRLHSKIVSGSKAYVVKRGKKSYDRNSMLWFFDTATHLTMTGIVWCRLGALPVWREAWLWYPTNALSLLIWSQEIFLYSGSQEMVELKLLLWVVFFFSLLI